MWQVHHRYQTAFWYIHYTRPNGGYIVLLTHACTRAHTHMHAHAHTHTCMYAHTCMHTRMHTHAALQHLLTFLLQTVNCSNLRNFWMRTRIDQMMFCILISPWATPLVTPPVLLALRIILSTNSATRPSMHLKVSFEKEKSTHSSTNAHTQKHT